MEQTFPCFNQVVPVATLLVAGFTQANSVSIHQLVVKSYSKAACSFCSWLWLIPNNAHATWWPWLFELSKQLIAGRRNGRSCYSTHNFCHEGEFWHVSTSTRWYSWQCNQCSAFIQLFGYAHYNIIMWRIFLSTRSVITFEGSDSVRLSLNLVAIKTYSIVFASKKFFCTFCLVFGIMNQKSILSIEKTQQVWWKTK